MLTGVEIAGVILGILPLVIQAVDWYVQGVKPMKEYWKYGPSLESLQGRLNIQAAIYEDSIRRLLIAAGISADRIHKLLDNVDDPWKVTAAWSTDGLQKKLQTTLGQRHFVTFIFAVQRIETVMKKLMAELKLDTKGKPKWIPDGVSLHSISISDIRHGRRAQHELNRISKVFSQTAQKELFDEFKEYNSAITAFVLNKEILAPQNEDNGIADAKSLVQYFDLVRKEACNLYEVLEENWKCSCKDPHNANLQLCFRGMATSTPVFKVCFSSGEDSKTWRKTCFHPGPRNGLVQQSSVDLLCSALCDIPQRGKLDDIVWTSHDWQIKVETEDSFNIQTSTVHHLRSLLAGEKKRSKLLNAKQRRQIAVALSYSVLQFYDSPWMHDLWGEEDIYFFTGLNKVKRLDISDPCFSRSFPRQHSGVLDSNERMSTHFLDLYIPNKPLFALGIVLLELCLSKTFDELQEISSIDASLPGVIEKYQVVEDNLESAFDEWGETFGQVVQRCLNPEFGLRPSEKRMDLDKFRWRVYKDIIAPLEEDLKLFM